MSARTIRPANFRRNDAQLSGERSVIEEVSPNACVCSKCRQVGAPTLQGQFCKGYALQLTVCLFRDIFFVITTITFTQKHHFCLNTLFKRLIYHFNLHIISKLVIFQWLWGYSYFEEIGHRKSYICCLRFVHFTLMLALMLRNIDGKTQQSVATS